MSDTAPERIWAFPKKNWFDAGASTHPVKAAGAKDVEYVRADLFDALEAERDRLQGELAGMLRAAHDNHDALCRAEKAEAERDRLREWNAEMVAKAASGGVLDGYRAMGAKLARYEGALEAIVASPMDGSRHRLRDIALDALKETNT